MDEGQIPVFMHGPFVRSINSLNLGIPLFLFLPTLHRQELDEAWCASELRRYEGETIESHLAERIEREVIVCCADDPYRPWWKVDELRQGHINESQKTKLKEDGIVELYPNCPFLFDLPNSPHDDDLFDC